MIFLPYTSAFIDNKWGKVTTYLQLFKSGCPILKSVLIFQNEIIEKDKINILQEYFGCDRVTVRYQYISSCSSPVIGGNMAFLKEINQFKKTDAILWLLEPVDRLKNEYGINLRFANGYCTIDIVGKGFDSSDINRGQLSPHQEIISELPYRVGYYQEWWKFLKFRFAKPEEYLRSKKVRLQKLRKLGLDTTEEIFNLTYHPLPFEMLKKLLDYINIIDNCVNFDDFWVSCSVYQGNFIFWDIQVPDEKMKIYGV